MAQIDLFLTIDAYVIGQGSPRVAHKVALQIDHIVSLEPAIDVDGGTGVMIAVSTGREYFTSADLDAFKDLLETKRGGR